MVTKLDRLREAAEARDRRSYVAACRIYEEMLELWGPDADVFWGLARAEFALSLASPDNDASNGYRAIECLRRAIALRPDRPDYHFALVNMLESVGATDFQGAANECRRTLELEPLFVNALDELASLYGHPDNLVSLDEAIALGELATRLDPTRSRWLSLSRLLERAGREAESEQALINSLLEMRETATLRY